MKRVRMFAGPNGSGKSTIFRQIQHALRYEYRMGTWVNADEIEHQMIQEGILDLNEFNIHPSTKNFNQFKSASSLNKKATDSKLKIDIRLENNLIVNKNRTSNSYEAALVAAFIREQLLKNGLTFSFETVMSHVSKINVLKEAVGLGYKPYLYFICTESPEINVERVRNRVCLLYTSPSPRD